MTDQEKTELAEKYIFQELSPEEHSILDELFQKDPFLRKKVVFQREVLSTLENSKLTNFEKKLKHLGAELEKEREGMKKRNRMGSITLKVAAVIAFLICMGIGLEIIFPFNPSEKEIFNEYFDPPLVPPFFDPKRSGDSATDSAYTYYKEEDFEKALPILERESCFDSIYARSQLYAGICLLKLNKEDKAVTKFEEVLNSGNLFYKGDALWYLGLSHLACENKVEARTVFEQLRGSHQIKREDAERILSQL